MCSQRWKNFERRLIVERMMAELSAASGRGGKGAVVSCPREKSPLFKRWLEVRTGLPKSVRHLDWLTQPVHKACADDRRRQFQQRFVDIQTSFKADSQLAKACKPTVRPLHYPAVLA